MPLRDPEKRRQYHAKYMKEIWYPKNRTKHIGYIRRLKNKVAVFIEEYKRARKCIDCGYPGKDFPQVLDFDHIDSNQAKKFNIGSWSHSVLSTDAIKQEIEKCELVCANCHRKRTYLRNTTKKVMK